MAGRRENLFKATEHLFAMIWSALVLGLMGSIHCLTMCGPLVLTLNARRNQSSFDKMLYNTGRIFTYCLMGLLAGIFGTSIQWAAGQQFLSVFTGVILLVGLLLGWLGSTGNISPAASIITKLKLRLSGILNGKPGNMWWFGVYNGLLPCGLTYLALAAAVSLGNVFQAVLYMALFGLGTSPMMWAIVSGFQRLNFKWASGNRLIRGFNWLMAVLLIIRGMGLGVPYLRQDNNSPHQHKSHIPVTE
jgi:sulfite exporter TauE/SafE